MTYTTTHRLNTTCITTNQLMTQHNIHINITTQPLTNPNKHTHTHIQPLKHAINVHKQTPVESRSAKTHNQHTQSTYTINKHQSKPDPPRVRVVPLHQGARRSKGARRAGRRVALAVGRRRARRAAAG